jgi:RNA-directed DNA polymerase
MQRKEQPIMPTGLERIAEKSRRDANLRFTTLAHHVTKDMIWRNLNHIPRSSASGVDHLTVDQAKKSFDSWIEEMMTAVHRRAYRAPAIRRVYIPKPGKLTKRPIGIPTVADRALQRSVAEVLSSIYESDFLDCSFGGRPNIGAHNALCTFNQIVMAKKVNWVLECDLKDFFGSLDHGCLVRFVEHRVGDPRILKLLQSWLKAGVLEEGEITESVKGTPQGGSISVMLSNIYLHYALDLWFAKVVKPRLKGDAYLVRYVDDFVVCFEHKTDAERFQAVLPQRLGKFSLELELSKTKLVEFGRFACERRQAKNAKLETVYFLGFTHYCSVSIKRKFMLGRKTEGARQCRFLLKLKQSVRENRHESLKNQALRINQALQGYYAFYGMGGNISSLKRTYRLAERFWRQALSTRSQRGYVTWSKFQKIKEVHPLRLPKLYVPFARMPSLAVL